MTNVYSEAKRARRRARVRAKELYRLVQTARRPSGPSEFVAHSIGRVAGLIMRDRLIAHDLDALGAP